MAGDRIVASVARTRRTCPRPDRARRFRGSRRRWQRAWCRAAMRWVSSLATWWNGDTSSRDITEVCIQAGELRGEIYMNAHSNRRAELRAAAIAVAFFILCAVAAAHSW